MSTGWPSTRSGRGRLLIVAATLALSLAACMVPLQSFVPSAPVEGTWSGTITIDRRGDATDSSDNGSCCSETTRRVLAERVVIELFNGQASGQVSYEYQEHLVAKQDYDPGLSDITIDTVIAGSGDDTRNTTVKVSLDDDGTYEMTYRTPAVTGTWQRDQRSVTTCHWPPPGCNPSDDRTHETAPAPGLSGASGSLDGKAAPGAKTVAGSVTTPHSFGASRDGVETITWSLSRK